MKNYKALLDVQSLTIVKKKPAKKASRPSPKKALKKAKAAKTKKAIH